MSNRTDDPFAPIAPAELARVAGGASRVTSRSGTADSQLTAMLTQITSSISDLAKGNNQNDPMQMMMMMMMMMGGFGGGGGGAAAAPPPPAQPPMPIINVSTGINGGWRRIL
jgi:hypothetical protein